MGDVDPFLQNMKACCHTRPILEFQPSWKSEKALACKMGHESGIILNLSSRDQTKI